MIYQCLGDQPFTCPACGSRTESLDAGLVERCLDPLCRRSWNICPDCLRDKCDNDTVDGVLDISEDLYPQLLLHVGHSFTCEVDADAERPTVTLSCETCNDVLLDARKAVGNAN